MFKDQTFLILKIKTILLRWLNSPKKENTGRLFQIFKLLPKNSYFKSGAVIFIVFGMIVIISSLAKSSAEIYSVSQDSESTRIGSYVYASQYMNPDEFVLEEVYAHDLAASQNILLQGSAVLANSSPSPSDVEGADRNEITTYIVQSGDVLSEIAETYGVSANTILWANNLTSANYLKAGQQLAILPVSGVLYTIKKGDTLDKVVKTYKGDLNKTIDYNGIPANGILAIGQQIIIPDGQKTSVSSTRSYATTASYSSSFPRPYSTKSHQFPWGQCTWYVAQRRYVPWGGNAKTWIYQAPQFGFATGNEPQVGAIVQTRENSLYGHVAYVESISGDYITISEMSLGQGILHYRTLRKDDWRIVGYIY